MTIIIAGERSGAGKTTLTLAILAYLAQQGLRVQSFKVGPDYIDPMFHSQVTGLPCRNLDPILTSEGYVQQCFAHHAAQTTHSLIEGVMGLFDGIPYRDRSDYASTAHIAVLLQIPVVLVIDCRSLSGSVAAIVQGYRHFNPRITLAGVILNQVGSDRHHQLLRTALDPLNIPILGVLFRQQALQLPARHLGLVPCGELPAIHQYFDRLANLAATQLEWSKLLPLLASPPIGSPAPSCFEPVNHGSNYYPCHLAIAQDAAFNFYYADNLDLLRHFGVTLIPFSPLNDPHLPMAIDGLYLGGGFPELFAEDLASNQSLKHQLQQLIQQGLPVYGECGGLMYLSQALINFDAVGYPLLGILPLTIKMMPKLTLGYRQAIVSERSSWLKTGQRFCGHEFHHSQAFPLPPQPLYRLKGLLKEDQAFCEGWSQHNVVGSYLHLHWGKHSQSLQGFLRACVAFSKKVR